MTLQNWTLHPSEDLPANCSVNLMDLFSELDPIALLSHSQKLHHYFVYAKAKTFQTNHMQQLFLLCLIASNIVIELVACEIKISAQHSKSENLFVVCFLGFLLLIIKQFRFSTSLTKQTFWYRRQFSFFLFYYELDISVLRYAI